MVKMINGMSGSKVCWIHWMVVVVGTKLYIDAWIEWVGFHLNIMIYTLQLN